MMREFDHQILRSFEVGDPIKTLFKPRFYMYEAFDIDNRMAMDDFIVGIRLVFTAPDAYGVRGPIEVQMDRHLPNRASLRDNDYLSDLMREMLHEMLKHEADESILVNGERRYDPHKGEQYAPRRP